MQFISLPSSLFCVDESISIPFKLICRTPLLHQLLQSLNTFGKCVWVCSLTCHSGLSHQSPPPTHPHVTGRVAVRRWESGGPFEIPGIPANPRHTPPPPPLAPVASMRGTSGETEEELKPTESHDYCPAFNSNRPASMETFNHVPQSTNDFHRISPHFMFLLVESVRSTQAVRAFLQIKIKDLQNVATSIPCE